VPVEVNTGEYILNQDANGIDEYYVATSPTSVGSVADLAKAEIKAISEHTDGSVFLLDKLPHEGEETLYDNSPIDSVEKRSVYFPSRRGGRF
jgi:hypothetical protein